MWRQNQVNGVRSLWSHFRQIFPKVGGASTLVWEAVSVLNGAHLSPSGRLGNLVRKYHQSVSSAASTLTTTTASGEASNARNKEVHRVHTCMYQWTIST